MSRIRTIKPDWLDDERMALASAPARVLSLALILLADDYGNGRAGRLFLSSRAFPGQPPECFDAAMSELVESVKFATVYEVDGQRYFSIRNWAKHQRIDKPGKPAVPPPPQGRGKKAQPEPEAPADLVYFVQSGDGGPIKIGRSWNPEDRVRRLSTGSHTDLTLLGVIDGGWRERDLHKQFAHLRLNDSKEWFSPEDDLVRFIREHSRPIRESVDDDVDSFAPRAIPSPPFHSDPIPEGVQGETDPDEDRQTICPADLEARVDNARIPEQFAKTYGVPIEAVRADVRETVGYWTIGGGAGKRKKNWLATVRTRLHELGKAKRLGLLPVDVTPTKTAEALQAERESEQRRVTEQRRKEVAARTSNATSLAEAKALVASLQGGT